MSCFVCSDLHTAIVAQWAVSQGLTDDATQAAIALRAANNYAHATRYEGRYPEERQPLQGLRALLAAPLPQQPASWFNQQAQCLHYQCAEGDTLTATPGGRLVVRIAEHAKEVAGGVTSGAWGIDDLPEAPAPAESPKDAAKRAFDAECERLRAAHPDLEVGQYQDTAAVNIRRMLKKQFPGVKFSVKQQRGSMVSSIKVRWVDGPTESAVDEILRQFKAGHFDGMDDSYHYSESAWNRTFGSVRYVDGIREHSDGLIDRAIKAAIKEHGAKDAPTVADFKAGRAYYSTPMANGDTGCGGHWSWHAIIHRTLADISA